MGCPQEDLQDFASFVPIGGRLFALDGVESYPIDHGPSSDMLVLLPIDLALLKMITMKLGST